VKDTVFNIDAEGMMQAIAEAIMTMESKNIRISDDALQVYVPKLAQMYIQHSQRIAPTDHVNLNHIRLDRLMGVKVITGYDPNSIVVSWTEGELYNIEPIIIKIK